MPLIALQRNRDSLLVNLPGPYFCHVRDRGCGLPGSHRSWPLISLRGLHLCHIRNFAGLPVTHWHVLPAGFRGFCFGDIRNLGGLPIAHGCLPLVRSFCLRRLGNGLPVADERLLLAGVRLRFCRLRNRGSGRSSGYRRLLLLSPFWFRFCHIRNPIGEPTAHRCLLLASLRRLRFRHLHNRRRGQRNNRRSGGPTGERRLVLLWSFSVRFAHIQIRLPIADGCLLLASLRWLRFCRLRNRRGGRRNGHGRLLLLIFSGIRNQIGLSIAHRRSPLVTLRQLRFCLGRNRSGLATPPRRLFARCHLTV